VREPDGERLPPVSSGLATFPIGAFATSTDADREPEMLVLPVFDLGDTGRDAPDLMSCG
jgi:hypothetical protein